MTRPSAVRRPRLSLARAIAEDGEGLDLTDFDLDAEDERALRALARPCGFRHEARRGAE